MIRKNDPDSDFWQLAERVSRKVDGFPPWKLGRLEQMDFKVGDKVRVRPRGSAADLFSNRTGVVVEVFNKTPLPYEVQFDNSSYKVLFQAEELELAPEEKPKFKVGDKVIVKSRGLEERERIVQKVGDFLPDFICVKKGSSFVYARPSELELVPEFKEGDKVIVNAPELACHGEKGEVIGSIAPTLLRVKLESGVVTLFFPNRLELVPELEQKSRFALEVTDTEFIAVSALGPCVELSINDDETIDLDPGQARRVAMMLLIAAEELEEE